MIQMKVKIIVAGFVIGNRTEWKPIVYVMITSNKQNWMSVKRESCLFSQVMITDRIGRHEVLLQIYYENCNFRK